MTVVVVDDHALFREGVLAILSTVVDVVVVAEAVDGAGAIAAVAEHEPDVVLMDVMLPEMNGVEATEACRAAHPDVAVVMVTMMDDPETVFAAMCAGARGYLVKGADHVTMLNAIRSAARGEVLFSAGVAERVLDFFRVDSGAAARRARPFPELTDREFEILTYIADGSTNEQVARHLALSAKTVANNLSRVFTKLQVTDRAQAIVKAHRAGIGDER
ncbi:MAG: response regulator transcription factor [Ilumatobacter sp.]|nr:response regulator transcription factor [Ilumatobacter sp.]